MSSLVFFFSCFFFFLLSWSVLVYLCIYVCVWVCCTCYYWHKIHHISSSVHFSFPSFVFAVVYVALR